MTDSLTTVDPIRARIHRPPLKAVKSCETHGEYESQCYLASIWTQCPSCADEAKTKQQKAADAAQAAERVERWERRLGHSGIPSRFHDRTLGSFKVTNEGQRRALSFAEQYVSEFDSVRKTGRGAIFIGNPGTGKTHIACGIGLHVMREQKGMVLFMTVQRLIRSVKDTWAKGSDMSETEAIEALVDPCLLILDEVGVQFGSDFERNTLFDVLNARYEQRKPTLFLSNLEKDEVATFLGERVMDRLREDGGKVISFAWDSYRSTVARESAA